VRTTSHSGSLSASARQQVPRGLPASGVQADNISTLVKAANVTIDPYWPGLFAKLFEKTSIEDLISNVGVGELLVSSAPASNDKQLSPSRKFAHFLHLHRLYLQHRGLILGILCLITLRMLVIELFGRVVTGGGGAAAAGGGGGGGGGGGDAGGEAAKEEEKKEEVRSFTSSQSADARNLRLFDHRLHNQVLVLLLTAC
jgi:ribosomal protein L12E/L44/L45/RPP1/RPP2